MKMTSDGKEWEKIVDIFYIKLKQLKTSCKTTKKNQLKNVIKKIVSSF